MKHTGWIVALLVASSTCRAGDIVAMGWGVHREKDLNASSDLPVQVQSLLLKMLPDADLVTPTVGEAYFIDLDKDADLELVATVDYSGRGFFNNVVVVRKRDGRFDWSQTRNNGHSIQDLPSHFVDANGDGAPELVLERFIDQYQGAQRVPVETVVYRWQSQGFNDDSDAFPQFYRTTVIPGLEEKLTKASAAPSTSLQQQSDEVFLLQTELARAKRRARINK